MKIRYHTLLAGLAAVALGMAGTFFTPSWRGSAVSAGAPPATTQAAATSWISLVPPTGTRPATVPTDAAPEGYHLVWHDEFDKDGPLNASDWGYENGFVRNQEAQYYQRENALCKDGFLVIAAIKETKPNPRFNGPQSTSTTATASTATAPSTARSRGTNRNTRAGWPNLPSITITSASINTRGKHEFTYGRFEIRAKIDTRAGSWPAFWTLGTSGGWPGNGEVDIMEYYRDMVLGNIAWQGARGATWNSVRKPLNGFPKDFSDTFHVWRMDWDETSIKLFLDDVKVNEQDLSRTVNSGGRANGVNPFVDRPVYLMLNQAIGGQNGGDYSQTKFPVYFYIDYVRVWQKTSAARTQPSPKTPQSP